MPPSPVTTATRRIGQLLTGLGALVVLVVLLAGTPLALVALAGNPLPEQVPTLDQIGTVLTSRDDGQLFLRALAILGWAGWATFALSVLVELPARVLRRPAPRLPGMRRQQRMVATLLGSVALILAVSPAATAATTLTTAPAGTGPTVVAATAPGPRPISAEQYASVQPGEPVYRVEEDDYLGHIAARYLGDFDRYSELAKQNKIRNPDRIRPGQLLRLPDDATDRGVRAHATGLVAMPKPPPAKVAPAPVGPPTAVPIPVQPPNGPDHVSLAGGAAGPARWTSNNRPLAVSAVIAVASVVGAQIGAALGLRRRAAPARPTQAGRHRLDP